VILRHRELSRCPTPHCQDWPTNQPKLRYKYSLSRETLAIVNNLGLSQRDDSAEIIQAIKQYMDGQINESVECRNLRSRRQKPGESFDDYQVTLTELTKTCNFCSTENIRDQIIEGVMDWDTVEHLLRQQQLTSEAAITICRAQETAKKQCQSIQDSLSESVLAQATTVTT